MRPRGAAVKRSKTGREQRLSPPQPRPLSPLAFPSLTKHAVSLSTRRRRGSSQMPIDSTSSSSRSMRSTPVLRIWAVRTCGTIPPPPLQHPSLETSLPIMPFFSKIDATTSSSTSCSHNSTSTLLHLSCATMSIYVPTLNTNGTLTWPPCCAATWSSRAQKPSTTTHLPCGPAPATAVSVPRLVSQPL